MFLNARIEEKVYILQTEGLKKFDPDVNPLVCKLNKSIYGLKQSGRNWLPTSIEQLETIVFEACVHDPCLFIKKVFLEPIFNNGLREDVKQIHY